MASVNPEQQSSFQQEAGAFLSTMDEVAPQVRLDYTVESLQRLEHFISEHFDPPGSKFVAETLLQGIGCYLGEVIIRNLGGHWNPDGKPEVNHIGPIEAIYPIEKAKLRFEKGKTESLAWAYHSIQKQAYEAGMTEPQVHGHPQPTRQQILLEADQSGEGGFMAFFKGLFGSK